MRKTFAKLFLGDNTKTWGEISRYVASKLDSKDEIHLSDDLRTRLNVWFQNAPNLALGVAGAIASTYVLNLDPALAKGVAEGGFSMMQSLQGGVRGQVVNDKSLIQGQASFVPADGMHALATAALVWQLVSMITVPQYLSQINRQLEQLNSRVEAIKSFLEQKEYAVLSGNLAYMRDI